MSDLSHPAAALGLGVALGASPGPVQALLMSEAVRGGVSRGLRAMAGANGTFGVLLLLLAAGLSFLEPGEEVVRVIKVAGGVFLLFLAADTIREGRRHQGDGRAEPSLHPAVRGVLAVVLNPGVWIFLPTTGAAVLADAARDGGFALSAATVVALTIGVSAMDGTVVLLAAGGARRLSDRGLRGLSTALAMILAVVGAWLVVAGIRA